MQDFVKRMRKGYARASAFLDSAGVSEERIDLRGLPDGEILILSFRLKDTTDLENSVFGEIKNQQIYLSLNDLISVLDFPIDYNPDTQVFSGWYVRENRRFEMRIGEGVVSANGNEFNVASTDIILKDSDVFVVLPSLENWFDLELEPNISEQFVILDAEPPLPIMERIARRKIKKRNDSRSIASLPRGEDDYKLLGIPKVDVNSRSGYRNFEGSDPEKTQSFNVRTSGEFAYGTLMTNVSANDEDQITNARVTYLQESTYPELLGPLGARRFEVGDIQTTRLPITGNAAPEVGVRVTNIDPLVRQSIPSTQISGYIFPGWDVELYRDNSLLAFAETDESGYYSFDNVRLFSSRNFFRVVAYGPQGEVREENVNVPYDQNREASDGAVYDVSLSMQNSQFYNKFDSTDPDKDTPHFVGFFETPLTAGTALRLGARYREEESQHKLYASAGVSTTVAGGLVNATVAADEDGEVGSEFVYTKQYGPHNFRADLDLATDNYNPGQQDRPVQVLSNRYALEGPFPFEIGDRPRYSTSFSYAEKSDGDHNISGRVNFNTTHKRLGFNQSFTYADDNNREDGALISSGTAVTGSIGKDTYRVRANYQIQPDNELDALFASWRRRISNDLETQLEVGHTLESDITRLSGQLNWRPEYATISPRFSYDSDGNVEGTLNTRFGLTASEQGGIVMSRDFVSGNGTINAFVFLDKDGDKVFGGEDEPIPDVRVLTPQNAGGTDTNENGVASINQLRPNIITDVFIDQATLNDPYWIPAEDGVSIMPRTGTSVNVEIPVHISGELDGTVYARKPDGSSVALRNLTLYLHNEDGTVEQKTKTAYDGFYLFSLVPPGRYALTIADSGVPSDMRRPRPQFIEIGHDGTTIFGNDVFLEAGKPDIPTEILADLDDYEAQHPHIDFSGNNYQIALNLGEYNSRLMMSFMWYRLKTRYEPILKGTDLYVPPSQSYALPRTGQHILRVGLKSENLEDAYARCNALVARGLACKVEVYPGAKKQKFAAVSRK
jgi:hypothetical protein